ncbi:hypothetical protein DHD08_09030 [Arenibacter sp. H213]|nr:hypothetical protein [Arenibacter sp. H213]
MFVDIVLPKQKKRTPKSRLPLCARGETRTLTPHALDPKYTESTVVKILEIIYKEQVFFHLQNHIQLYCPIVHDRTTRFLSLELYFSKKKVKWISKKHAESTL